MNTEPSFELLLDDLENRGGMYLQPYTFKSLVAFFTGYEICAGIHGGKNPFAGMSEFVQCRLGRTNNLTWTAEIWYHFATDEEDAIRLLFQFIRDLQQTKQDRGLEWIRSEFERMRHFKRKRPTNPHWPNPRPK